MTLNGLYGHFTLYVQYHELPLAHYLLFIWCRLFITRGAKSEEVREASIANSDPQSGSIFGIRGKSADLPRTLYRRNLNK